MKVSDFGVWKLHKQNTAFGSRYHVFYPERSEGLLYSNNSKDTYKPSAFDPNQQVLDGTVSICPKCKSEGPYIDHGDLAQCTCGLMMQKFGNCLKVWLGDWPSPATLNKKHDTL